MQTFSTGKPGPAYTVSVSNVGDLATSGEVTVTDTLPTALTATEIGGPGWTCALGNLTCTRTDALAPSATYPAITIAVMASSNAPAAVTNSVIVSGGGDVNTANNSSSDYTALFTPDQVAHAWQPLKNPAPIPAPAFPIHGLLLTDGTVMVQEFCSNIWHRLIPDAFGSYVNGTWSPMASMQPGYRPAFYSSAMLADGHVAAK